jgi:ferrous iron transport protein B
MGIVFALGEVDEESSTLREELPRHYNGLQAYCIMIFCLLSAPCIATIAVTKRESNSWFWALFQLLGLTVLAYIITTLIYQIGSLFMAA